MHKLDFRTYLGDAGEQVKVNAMPSGSGSTRFTLDGIDKGVRQSLSFNLSNTPGTNHVLLIDLFGASGEVCAIGVQDVDGGTDVTKLAIVAPFPTRRGEWDITVGADHAMALTAELAAGATIPEASRRRRAAAKKAAKKSGR